MMVPIYHHWIFHLFVLQYGECIWRSLIPVKKQLRPDPPFRIYYFWVTIQISNTLYHTLCPLCPLSKKIYNTALNNNAKVFKTYSYKIYNASSDVLPTVLAVIPTPLFGECSKSVIHSEAHLAIAI